MRGQIPAPLLSHRTVFHIMYTNTNASPEAPDGAYGGHINAAFITEQRLKMLGCGYGAILPLNGKAPTIDAWSSRTSTTEHEIRAWERVRPAETNTGLLTKDFPAFDIDISVNPDAAQDVANLIAKELCDRRRVMVRTGNAPKRAVLCRTTEPFKKFKVEFDTGVIDPGTGEITVNAIEVLAHGQQIVCFGTHPDTRRPYEWEGGSPDCVPGSELPSIREADARAIVGKASALLVERFGFKIHTPVKAARPDTPVAEAKTTETATAYGAAALRSACETIVNAVSGSQDVTLNTECFAIGQLVAGGELPETEALSALRAAAANIPDYDPKNPWKAGDLTRKVERSFTEGGLKPRAAPEPLHFEFRQDEAPGVAKARGESKPNGRVIYLPTATPFVRRPLRAPEGLYGGHYYREFLNMTLAMPGAGKTTNAITEILGMAIGYDLIATGGIRIGEQSKPIVNWYINGEDPQFLIDLRFAAAMQRYGITYEDVAGRLFVDSGRARDIGFVFVSDEAGRTVVNHLVIDAVIKEINGKAIDVFSLDPYSAFHRMPENDNTKQLEMMNQLAIAASETRSACELVAHPRKVSGEQLTIDDIRGGSALHGAIRALRLGNGMSKDEGSKAGLPEGEYRRYFHLVDGKPSLRQWSDTQSWRRMGSIDVTLDDGSTTSVGAVESWYWPSADVAEEARDGNDAKSLTPQLTDTIIAACGQRGLRADKQSPAWAGYQIMPLIGLDVENKGDKKKMERWLGLLVKSGDLEIRLGETHNRRPCNYITMSEKTRRKLEGLEN
jgi:hypothetical protein